MLSELKHLSFLCSKPFSVLGPQKTLFYVHSDLLAKCSPVLARDVNGEMREKHLETIEIKDVDGDIDDDTVMRFIEYAYQDDYQVPEPDILQLSTDSEELEEAFWNNPLGEASDDSDSSSWAPTAKKPKKDKKIEQQTSFDGPSSLVAPTSEPIPTPEDNLRESRPGSFPIIFTRDALWDKFCSKAHLRQAPAWVPWANEDPREDFTEVFLCHTRLYKFADRYRCDSLMDLTLQKLRLNLSHYIFHPERASAIVELIRYTYAHTYEPRRGQDKLRKLVLNYATSYIRELMQEPSFVDLVKEGGSFAGDITARVAGMVS